MLYLITLQMYELEFRVKQSKLMWLYAMLPTNIDVRVAVDILLARISCQSKLMWLYAMLPTNIDVRVAVDILVDD